MKEDGMVTPGEYGMGTDLDGRCRVAYSQSLSNSIFSATHLTFEPRKETSCILTLEPSEETIFFVALFNILVLVQRTSKSAK